MARPCKKRLVCKRPVCSDFRPECSGEAKPVELSLDEWECIRLMDHVHLEQELCAAQLGVARTTVQAIYKSAREKIAIALVEARPLRICGGNVHFCQNREGCGGHHCIGRLLPRIPKGGNITMRIAVTFENGQVFQHFGHTEAFKIYDVEDGKVVSAEVADTNGQGHGALGDFLKENGVTVLICGGIGGGARAALAEAEIELFGGVKGDADAAVAAYLAGNLEFDPEAKCDHHGEGHHHHHEEGHKCGAHGCGKH